MKYATEIDFSFNNTMTIFIDNIKENWWCLSLVRQVEDLPDILKMKKIVKYILLSLMKKLALIAAKDAEDYVIGDIQDYEWTKKFSE